MRKDTPMWLSRDELLILIRCLNAILALRSTGVELMQRAFPDWDEEDYRLAEETRATLKRLIREADERIYHSRQTEVGEGDDA